LCPTAAMAIPENHNEKDYSSACDYIAWCYSGQTYVITEKQEKVAAWLKEKIQVYQKIHSHNECLNWLWGHYPIPEKENNEPEKKDENLFSDWTDGQIEALEWALECFFEHVGKMPNVYSKNIDYIDTELSKEDERRFKEKIDEKLSELHRFGVA